MAVHKAMPLLTKSHQTCSGAEVLQVFGGSHFVMLFMDQQSPLWSDPALCYDCALDGQHFFQKISECDYFTTSVIKINEISKLTNESIDIILSFCCFAQAPKSSIQILYGCFCDM